jgi:hypothetical protein
VRKSLKPRDAMLLELLAFWGGGTTAGELAQVLECGRREAGQARIQAFAREFPKTILYDRYTHRVNYLGDADSLRFCPSDADRLLSWLIGEQIAASSSGGDSSDANYRKAGTPFSIEVIDVSALIPHPVSSDTFRAVLAGVIRHKSLSIVYQSKRRISTLSFSPHTIVWTSGRYHVRGYASFSDEVQFFVDLVLARILESSVGSSDDYVGREQDDAWHRRRDLTFELVADLETVEREAVRRDYGLFEGGDALIVRSVRDALAPYVIREVTGRRVEGRGGPVWSLKHELAAEGPYQTRTWVDAAPA